MGNCFEDIMAFMLLPSITDSLVACVVVRAKPKYSTASVILWSVGVCGGYWLSSVFKTPYLAQGRLL